MRSFPFCIHFFGTFPSGRRSRRGHELCTHVMTMKDKLMIPIRKPKTTRSIDWRNK